MRYPRKVTEAFTTMHMAIQEGREYHDAHVDAILSYDLTTEQGQQLQELYDEDQEQRLIDHYNCR